jgi:6-pyruvoyltetrahydropterin/6-carboxytetrahydropterin synthase
MIPFVEIGVDLTFEAAHWLPMVPPEHKCHRMHGHSYRVTVIVAGPVGDDGMVMDFAKIREAAQPLVAQLDHHTLNDLIPNPTAELIAVWLWDNLLCASIPVATVTVHETAHTSATYHGGGNKL